MYLTLGPLSALDDIQRFVKQSSRRPLLQRILRQADIKDQVAKLARDLDDAINAFNVSTSREASLIVMSDV